MWIGTQRPEEHPVIKELYEQMHGRVVPMLDVFTLKPELLKAVVAITQACSFSGTSLGRYREELIAAYVCHQQRCKLCTVSHSRQLLNLSGQSREWVRELINDPDAVELPAQDRAILRFAGKMTLAAAAMTAGDTEALRAAGLTDPEILDVGATTAFYNFVPRIIGAFGLTISQRQVEWATFLGYDASDATPDMSEMEIPGAPSFIEDQARLWRQPSS